MAIGTIAKANLLSQLMSEQISAQISQMQASQSFSNVESDFAHGSVIRGDEMLKVVKAMDWIQILTIVLTPLILGVGVATAGLSEGLATATSFSSAGAQVTLGSATAGTQSYKAGLDSQIAINKGGVESINHNIKTNFDSLKHESETQIKVGGDIAQMISNEGQIANQKIIGR
ncbi:hypothetical protein RHABOEDO_001650 [Candidatus Rhabdochlamydia oedothoracis]|uniref:Uncharacterized protein n=1 Tax=Candidatus Rhabdochlamydia oedothoracis TaxID=2720720 RepID=A0ABX8V6W5_9BACT|nr:MULTISPECIES: hypothetical protein [Rhabdochlamydia]KAG6559253.1 hypothetical protein RHOW815_000738 [Candidatus Rhabdochlamydia sp. W815]QYF49332.1 hypothetical protein RHABOEDO_001650 [Candidatus Rhabdochlamydia oedothoracis]